VLLLLDVLDFAMLARALFSWFDPMREGRISTFLFMVTEPIIAPVRGLCYHKNWFQKTPLDVPFLITIVLLMLLRGIIEFL
jgi:YggT family protein